MSWPNTKARYVYDADGNVIGLMGPSNEVLAQEAFGPALKAWNPTLLSKVRSCSLLGSDTSLCSANGAFRFAGFQADGVNFTAPFFESAANTLNNPGGYARVPIADTGTGGGGVTSVSTLTASFATNVMTVTVNSEPILPGSVVAATGVTAGTFILPYGTSGATGTGGTGTYILSTTPGTLGSRAATATYNFLERVADATNTSSETTANKKFAWKLKCGGAHYNVSNHARSQITTPTHTPYKHYTHKFEMRWATDNISNTGSTGDSYSPPNDTMFDCLLWQLHQFNSSQPFETHQVSGGIPAFKLLWESGKFSFTIAMPDENMGGTATNAGGSTYKSFDSGDNMTTLYWSWYPNLNSYTKFTFDFFLDERGIQSGGKGYFKVYAGNQLMVDYYGPTLMPARGADNLPVLVDAEVSFGMYFYNTPFDAVATNTVSQSIVASAVNYNPFRDCSLLIRQYFILGG